MEYYLKLGYKLFLEDLFEAEISFFTEIDFTIEPLVKGIEFAVLDLMLGLCFLFVFLGLRFLIRSEFPANFSAFVLMGAIAVSAFGRGYLDLPEFNFVYRDKFHPLLYILNLTKYLLLFIGYFWFEWHNRLSDSAMKRMGFLYCLPGNFMLTFFSGFILYIPFFIQIPYWFTNPQRIDLGLLVIFLVIVWYAGNFLINTLPWVLKLFSKVEDQAKETSSMLNEICSDLSLDKSRLFIVHGGFYNAMAFYQKKPMVIIGRELLDLLEQNEVKAILCHEKGHLEDHQALGTLDKINERVYIAFIASITLILAQNLIFNVFGWVLMIYGFSLMGEKYNEIKQKAEFNADKYVKDFDPELEEPLQNGLKKLSQAIGVSQDFCKDNNIAHLDHDERVSMLANETFEARKNKKFAGVSTLFWQIFIGIVVGVLISYFDIIP